MQDKYPIIFTILLTAPLLNSCQTAESGAKVVDRNRGEIVISTPVNSLSAMPEGSKDASITKAREKLERNLKDNSRDAQNLVSLAQLQLAQDKVAEAEETARKVLLIDTKNQGARKVLAQSAIKRQKHDLALIFLSALGGEASKDSDVFNMLGMIALSRSDNDEAMRLWKHALTLNPGDISVRMNLGVMYLKNRLFSQASTQFERVLKIAPNHQDAKLHLGIIEMTRGKNLDAQEAFKAVLAQDKTNKLALFNLAVAQKNLGQYEESISTLKRYIKASPSKTEHTDQAFAMIDDINAVLAANNQKVSDEDLQSLAGELAARQAPSKQSAEGDTKETKQTLDNQKQGNKELTVKTPVKKAEAPTQNSKPADTNISESEIEALEKQLKSQAH